MDQFVLTVELGNDAMRTGWDVAELLRKVAHAIEDNDFRRADSGRARDVNGNTVAKWEVK